MCMHGMTSLSQKTMLSFAGRGKEEEGSHHVIQMNMKFLSVADDKLFLHGGRASLLLDDFFALDLIDKTWVEILAEGLLPSARYKHILCVSSGRLHLIGGDGDQLGLAYMHSMHMPSSQASQPWRCCPAKLQSSHNMFILSALHIASKDSPDWAFRIG